MRKTGVIVSNNKVGYIVISIDGRYVRMYRSEIPEGQSDRVGRAIEVMVYDRPDAAERVFVSGKIPALII